MTHVISTSGPDVVPLVQKHWNWNEKIIPSSSPCALPLFPKVVSYRARVTTVNFPIWEAEKGSYCLFEISWSDIVNVSCPEVRNIPWFCPKSDLCQKHLARCSLSPPWLHFPLQTYLRWVLEMWELLSFLSIKDWGQVPFYGSLSQPGYYWHFG